MRFPIDTSSLRFTVAAPPEPARRRGRDCAPQSRSVRAGENGTPLWRVPLIALGDGPGDVMRVVVAGGPRLEPGATVAVKDLTAQTWARDGRRGVSLRARAIVTDHAPAAPARVTRAARTSSVRPLAQPRRRSRVPRGSHAEAAAAGRGRKATTAHTLSARYRDAAGVEHRIRLERSPVGCWRVLDVGPHETVLVEELTGRDDGRPQAEALARDYATQAGLAARMQRRDAGRDVVWAA